MPGRARIALNLRREPAYQESIALCPEAIFLGAVNRKLVITLLVIAAGLAGLYFYSGSLIQEAVVIADADQVATDPTQYGNRELRVRGFVKPGSIKRSASRAQFVIEHKGKELPVYFNGATQLPDTFTDAAAVRADGHLDNGRLISGRVEAKCASKYEASYKEEAAASTSRDNP